MELGHFFLILALLLLSARVLGELAQSIRIPAVLGELLAGIILGPSLFNLIQDNEIWQILAEIGIVLLLFEVGLETDFHRLTQAGKKPYLVAITGFVVPFILAFNLTFWGFHLSLLVALLMGGALTATSIGITVRVLSDLKQRHSHEAQIVIGAAVLDDVLGVLLLAFLFDFAVHQTWSATSILKTTAWIVGFMLLTPVIANRIMALFASIDRKKESPGLLLTLCFSLMLFCAYVADLLGVPVIMGGFVAGLAVSRKSGLTERLGHQMKPVIQLYTPIFFVMVGASLNLRLIPWHSSFLWGLTASLLAIALLGKLCAGFVIKESRRSQTIIGVSMMPRGEVGLVFAKLGLMAAIFTNTEYAALLLVVVLTTFLPPFLLARLYRVLTQP